MGGTKSHKIPFWELAKGLINRYELFIKVFSFKLFNPIILKYFSGHNITFLSGFLPDFHVEGLIEITPASLVHYIQNYTNWDLMGESVMTLKVSFTFYLTFFLYNF